VNEHILAAIFTDDEAKALLRVEELYDALSFTDNLGGHSATTARAAAAETAAAAAAEATASTAEAAATVAVTAATAAVSTTASTASESATVTYSTAAAAAAAEAIAAAETRFITTETVALVPAATATIAFAPSVETHPVQTSLCPQFENNQRAGPKGATGCARFSLTHGSALTGKKGAALGDSGCRAGRETS
jgi:hypothetical protein